MTQINTKSKFLGGMIGSALGDCIGELAFRYGNEKTLLTQVAKKDIIRYTDDTAMAIGIAETIITSEGDWTPQDLGRTFHANFNEEPYRGYGSGPPQIFRTIERSDKNYQEVASQLFGGEGSYGNGASMRISPLGLFYYDSSNMYEVAKKSAVATHTHSWGIDGAAILAKLYSLIVPKQPGDLTDQQKNGILDELIEFSNTDKYKNVLKRVKELILQSKSLKYAEGIIGSGVLAYTSVPFSIFAFLYNPEPYRKNLINTVLLSRDRDTVGAMVGGLLGAYLGIEGIPDEWIQKLENKSYIESLALGLFELKND
jgi:poly(ADP-ribose) glycohydrolase ARH3